MRSIVLASSPVVGPITLEPLAVSLERRGVRVATPSAPPDVGAFVEAVAAAVDPDRPHVLAGYSAAGPRLFAVAARSRPAAVLFLDARLPADGVAPVAEAGFAELLDRLPVDDAGLLPPWPTWWPDDAIATLCPDPELRERFVADCPRVPRAMYDVPIPAPPYDGPRGYIALGDGYADQRAVAEARGWPVRTVPVGHLAPLVAPEPVADAIVDLAEAMGAW